MPGSTLFDLASVAAIVHEEGRTEGAPGPHGSSVVFLGTARPGVALISRLDKTGIHGRLTGKWIVAIASINISGDKGIEHTINALLAAGFPCSIVGPLLAGFAILGHWVYLAPD